MNEPESNYILSIPPQQTTIKAKCPRCQKQTWLRTDIYIKPYFYISLVIGYELDFVLTCKNCKLTIFQHIGLFDDELNTILPIDNQNVFLTFVNLRVESKLYAKIQQLKQSE